MTVTTKDRSGSALMAGTPPGGRRDDGGPVRLLQVYAFLLVLIPPTYIIGPLGAVGTPATVVALVALILWVAAVLTPGGNLVRTVVPVRVVMGLLVATMFLAYAVLHVRYVPGFKLLASDRSLIQVLSWAGIALLAAEGLRNRHELYRVLRALVAAVGVMAVVGLLQFRAGINLVEFVDRIPGLHENNELFSVLDRSGFRRPSGTATHPIEFGCVIAITLPLALHLARFDLMRPPVRRWLPFAAVAMGVPVAVSRSAVVTAVVAAVVVFVGIEARLRPRALAAVAAFLVATYATAPGLLGTLRNLFVNFGSDESITYRTADYPVVGEYIRRSPLLGQGPGTYFSDVSGHFSVLDNQYLLSAVETGLIGLAVVACYLLATSFLGRGARRCTKDVAVRDLGQALAAASLAGAVASATFDSFSFLMFAGVIPLCLGIAGAVWAIEHGREHATGLEPSVDAERPDPLGGALAFAVPGGAADPQADDASLPLVDLTAPASALGSRSGGNGHADEAPDRVDENQPLVRDLTEAHDVAAGLGEWEVAGTVDDGSGAYDMAAGLGELELAGTVDDRAEPHDLRRVVALVGAGVAVLVLVSLPFAIGSDRDDPDLAVDRIDTPALLFPAGTATTSTTTATTESQPLRPAARGSWEPDTRRLGATADQETTSATTRASRTPSLSTQPGSSFPPAASPPVTVPATTSSTTTTTTTTTTITTTTTTTTTTVPETTTTTPTPP